jgi:hypothetical protein
MSAEVLCHFSQKINPLPLAGKIKDFFKQMAVAMPLN